jgi:hypothetical protein
MFLVLLPLSGIWGISGPQKDKINNDPTHTDTHTHKHIHRQIVVEVGMQFIVILVEIFFFFYPLFSPISWYPIVIVATILSHRYNSHTGSGETQVESHASSDTQPNQAALLLNTARIQPGSQPHQCVEGNTVYLATMVSAHCAQPTTGVAGAR